MSNETPPINEFERPPVYDKPAGVAQVAASVRGKPMPDPPDRKKPSWS